MSRGLSRHLAAAQPESLLRQHDDRAAFRRLVRQARQAARRRPARRPSTPASGRNSTAWRLPSVIVPGLVEQQRVHVAGRSRRPCRSWRSTLCCITRSMPAMPIAESSPPIVVGIRQTSSDDEHGDARHRAGAGRRHAVGRVRLQRRHGEQEDQRRARRSGCSARSRSASSGAARLRRARSSGRGTSRPGST